MKPVLFTLPVLFLLGACAPLPTLTTVTRPPIATPVTTPGPTRVTTVLVYATAAITASGDNPVLAAVVGFAPRAPTAKGRQPWRAEEIQSNLVVLRSNATAPDYTSFETSMASQPYEMSFNAISSAAQTTLTATYSSAYAATAQDIFSKLDKQFKRVQ